MSFDDAELERYARHIVLREIGGAGQARLKAARVAVVGTGGIGSPVIEYLAAAGVGTLVLIDDDRVDLSNLQRQTVFSTSDVGDVKVSAARAAAQRLNPYVLVEEHPVRLSRDNAQELLGGADVVVDGCDNFATRLAVADAALALRVPLVSAAAAQFEGQLAVYRGWEANKPCYRCFVGDDPDRAEVSCADIGVLGALVGLVGSAAALEAIRVIVPFGDDPAGRITLIDALAARYRTITLPKDPGCPACGD